MAFSATYVGQICEEVVTITIGSAIIIDILNFSESTTGEDSGKFFLKEFCLSTDGILFTNYRLLTKNNLKRIKFKQNGVFYIKLRYTRQGITTTGTITFNSISLSTTTYAGTYLSGQITKKSIFKDFAGYNLIVQELAMNLLEKIIIGNGILPSFVERSIAAKDIPTLYYTNTGVDEDFFAIWKNTTEFLSIIEVFCENYRLIYYDREILLNFLSVKGLYFCGGESLEDLQYIATNYFKEYSKRGTLLVLKKKGEELEDGTLMPVNGELQRLLCSTLTDEFLFSFNSNNWIVNKTCPLYRGIRDVNCNKEESDTESMADLVNYNSANTIQITEDDIQFFDITTSIIGNFAGIGDPAAFPPFLGKINVDIDCDYLISFWLKNYSIDNKLLFGVNAFDVSGNLIMNAFSDKDNFLRNDFINLTNIPNTPNTTDSYYLVRAVIYKRNSSTEMVDNLDLNWSSDDKNLKFQDNTAIKKISIKIGVFQDAPMFSNIKICNLKMFPLKTPYSRYFVQGKDFMDFFLKNNNNKISRQQIETILRNELLPISVNFKVNYI